MHVCESASSATLEVSSKRNVRLPDLATECGMLRNFAPSFC